MNLRILALMPFILIFTMIVVFAAQAEDSTVLFVEEGTLLQDSPSDVTTLQETSALGYKITTSENDPSCDTGFNGYVNLEDHGISVTARIPTGNNYAIGPFFTNVGAIQFFDRSYQGLRISDDGFILFGDDIGKPWEPQIIPQTASPNAVAALLWQDMKIVYNKNLNHGVSLGTSPDGNILVVEYDDVRQLNAPSNRYDMSMVMRRKVSNAPGDYEIVYAYDNLNGTLAGPLTIGVENAAGNSGVALVNKGDARQVIKNGFMVCFDAVSGAPPSATPSSIQASDGTYEDKVRVTWGDVNQAASYDVFRADENGANEAKIGTAGDNLFNDISAAASITYTYRVKACNEYGCSDPSPHDTGWRAGDDDPPPPPPPPLDNTIYLPMLIED